MRILYTLIWILALPLVLARLYARARKEPGYRQHIGERFGRYTGAPSVEPMIWIHAVSVGETRAAEPLIRQLTEIWPQHRILLTHMTPTGRATGTMLFQDELRSNRLVQCYLPYDIPFLINRLIQHFKPVICILMETEVWPNLIYTCHQQAIPVALVNARLSPKSLKKAQRMPGLIRPASAALTCVAAQTASDAQRIAQLGAPRVVVTGNSKFDVSVPAEKITAGDTLREHWGARKVLLCASTREGEEELILDAFLKTGQKDLLLLIVPRHPQRFDQVEQLLQQRQIPMLRKSRLDQNPVPEQVQVVLGDTMGEMASYYVSCDLAFIGGSLLRLGGQNLIEACAVAKPVLIGPHTFNFDAISTDAINAGAAIRIGDAAELFDKVSALMADDTRRLAMGQNALAFARLHRGATARTVALLEELMQ